MSDRAKLADIETLAKMAARLAGRDPSEHVEMVLGEIVVFDDVIWRYPDFLLRAESAYNYLASEPVVQNSYPAKKRHSA